MRILVCGSREWKDVDAVRRCLSRYYGNHTLIHGAARGADTIAADVARSLGWEVIPYPADWRRFGRAAGPRRNAEMLRTGPDTVTLQEADVAAFEVAGGGGGGVSGSGGGAGKGWGMSRRIDRPVARSVTTATELSLK